MTTRSFFTLLLALAIAQVSLVAVPTVNALQNVQHNARRAPDVHIDFSKRMIRKRSPQESEPEPSLSITPTDTPTPTGSRTTSSPISTTTRRRPADDDEEEDEETSTSETSTSTSSTSSTSQTSTESSTVSTPTSTSSTTSRSSTRSTATRIVTATTTQTELPPAQDPDATFLSKSAIIGLIVTGSVVVGGALIWTVIRKWKFGASRHFEDRLEPLSWEPKESSGLPHDPTVAALHRGASQNSRRPSGDGSVHNMTTISNHSQPQQFSMAPDFPPPHDFTAGPSNGYVPPAGYVDMYRGPSPPNAYGGAPQYETPNPYDAHDYNNAYGQRRY